MILFLFVQITWRDIAGLDEVITELKDTVILPVQKRHLFEGSRLLQPPKGRNLDRATCAFSYSDLYQTVLRADVPKIVSCRRFICLCRFSPLRGAPLRPPRMRENSDS